MLIIPKEQIEKLKKKQKVSVVKGKISATLRGKAISAISFTLIVETAWIILVFVVFINIIKILSPDKINQISTVLLQSSGILIGFVGVSAFFFIGKIGDLALTTYKEALKTSNLLNKCRLLSENVFTNTEGIEHSKTAENKTIQHLHEERKESAEIDQCEKCENEHKKLLKTMKETLSNASKVTHRATTVQVSIFALSLILCLIAVLTSDGSYLESSVALFGLGLIFLVYSLYAIGSVAESITDLLNDFQSMNVEIRLHTREKARIARATTTAHTHQ
jgi:ABC-type transport system involved in multi-copper enzyme maturation permease subunit